MNYRPENPIIVQSDRTVLLEVNHPMFETVRDKLASFAELVKSPEFMHTYRITPLSLWNAAAAGISSEEIVGVLEEYAKYDVPATLIQEVKEYVRRYGLVKLVNHEGRLALVSEDPLLIKEIASYKSLQKYIEAYMMDGKGLYIQLYARGLIKQELIHLGYPVEDLAGYSKGETLSLALREQTASGKRFVLRHYQKQAVDAYYAGGSVHGGSGVLVLPCGAGKTVIGLAAMAKVGMATLILTSNVTSVRQWIQEILDKTDIHSSMIGEYTGDSKEVRPITVTTYQILTYRPNKEAVFPHLSLFKERNWGLIIYDEVHLLPAPVFRITADIQAKRRLGLTATLVREDGREEDVFTLVGPKKVDVPWKELEKEGWIATAQCTEYRVSMPYATREVYALADSRQKFRIASENPNKFPVVRHLLHRHQGQSILVIGQYVEQLKEIAAELNAPLITGKTPQLERERLYTAFRNGEEKVLVVSKVANFAIDLPDASVAIQVSGTFGSRQEEAQRLGRILRPKEGENTAYFYTVVTRDSKDQEFAVNRQLFLVEQGYRYSIEDAESEIEVGLAQ